MTIESNEDLENLKKIGRIVGLTLREMSGRMKPGMTTLELDEIGAAFLDSHGARSAPILAYEFPGATCISVNDEAAHGIPSERVIREGDLVNIDVSAELDGYFADAGVTIPVPPVTPLMDNLCRCTRRALNKAIAQARAGRPINRVGQAVEREAEKCGLNVIHNLTGHGIGRHIHEYPQAVLNYYEPKDRRRFTPGLVVTLEPFLSAGAEYVATEPDGWTLRAPDGSLNAQFEHTLVVTRGKPIIVTAV
jgi:methionyl aminopeptidase